MVTPSVYSLAWVTIKRTTTRRHISTEANRRCAKESACSMEGFLMRCLTTFVREVLTYQCGVFHIVVGTAVNYFALQNQS